MNLDLYVRSMGKALRVIAVFPSGEEGTRQANEYMQRHRDAAVVAEGDGLILLANTYDRGVRIEDNPARRSTVPA